jgi:hypothetical protein
MMKYTLIILALFLAQPANAEEEEKDRKIQYKQKTEIDFSDLNVEAALIKPAGSLVLERKQASFNPLIKLRTNFNEEIDKSTDEIK